jgi:hypothetical protein
MKADQIGEQDSLFRHVVFPLAFGGRAFQWDKTMKLFDEPDGSILASLAWERYVPTTAHIHAYGCRLASRMNADQQKKDKYREKDRRIYSGAYQLRADHIRALATTNGLEEVLSAEVIHHVEAGEIAHTDLRITLKRDSEFGLEGTKTAILACLWNACCGPLVHKCDCDQEILQHPSHSLPDAPSGPYRDMRPYLERLWYLLRFHVCSWLWRKKL